MEISTAGINKKLKKLEEIVEELKKNPPRAAATKSGLGGYSPGSTRTMQAVTAQSKKNKVQEESDESDDDGSLSDNDSKEEADGDKNQNAETPAANSKQIEAVQATKEAASTKSLKNQNTKSDKSKSKSKSVSGSLSGSQSKGAGSMNGSKSAISKTSKKSSLKESSAQVLKASNRSLA